MIPVAFLSASCMLESNPDRRDDYWEHDRQFNPMRDACRERGIDLQTVIWDDPALDPDDFEALIVGTTWDYVPRADLFLTTLERLSARRPLFNPLATIRWNLSKGYLRDLETSGAPIVPTLWCERADESSVAEAFDAFRSEEVVIKPQVGAAAWRQARLRRGDPLPATDALPPGPAMIQPFLPAIESEGEYSLVFFDRVFSHCALKTPAPGDYRIQSCFGGRERPHDPSGAELKAAQRVVDSVEGPLLYARVDMVRTPRGELAVMELELIEPYYYPEQGPGFEKVFAAALARALRDSGTAR